MQKMKSNPTKGSPAKAAPAVYRPQPLPRVLQTKLSVSSSAPKLKSTAVKPSLVVRPATKNILQLERPIPNTVGPNPNSIQLSIRNKKKTGGGGGGGGGKKKGGGKSPQAQAQSKAARSFNNICHYRSGWVKRNNITEQTVADFIDDGHPQGIRGHSSGDNSMGEQDNTTNDCLAYKHWHESHPLWGWRG